MNIKTIGIIGMGEFGQFMAKYLQKYFIIHSYDVRKITSSHSLKEVCHSDVIIFAVPAASLVSACKAVTNYIRKDTIIMDVMSVKEYPISILKKCFPKHQIIATHPLFGVSSGKGGIARLPIILINISATSRIYRAIKQFLSTVLLLDVVEQSAKEHDKTMAYVLGLSHYIGRALSTMHLPSNVPSTPSYNALLGMAELHGSKSQALFDTIQNYNTYADVVRDEFKSSLEC